MKRIKIGLLPAAVRNDRLYNILQEIGDVSYLTPVEMSAKYDIIVLPEGMGINPNLPCFIHGEAERIPMNFIDPTIEKFRVHALKYYLDMDPDITIVGLGDNAAMLWNELGKKVVVTSFGIQLLDDIAISNNEIIGKRDHFVNGFQVRNIIGLMEYTYELGTILTNVKRSLLSDLDQEMKEYNENNPPVVPKVPVLVNQTGEKQEEAC